MPEPQNKKLISQAPLAIRKVLRELTQERAVLAYSFSWLALQRLADNAVNVGFADKDTFIQELCACVVAHKDSELKPITTALNERISEIMTQNDIKTLEAPDPWGRSKHFVLYNSSTSSLNRQNLTSIMMREFNIPAKDFQDAIDRATTKTPYTSLQLRDAEDEWDGKKK